MWSGIMLMLEPYSGYVIEFDYSVMDVLVAPCLWRNFIRASLEPSCYVRC